MKEESVKSKPIKIGELVSAFVLDLTTARRQKERGKKNEEKIISSRNEYGICPIPSEFPSLQSMAP